MILKGNGIKQLTTVKKHIGGNPVREYCNAALPEGDVLWQLGCITLWRAHDGGNEAISEGESVVFFADYVRER